MMYRQKMRDVRNAIKHEYEENAEVLSALANRMLSLVEPLIQLQNRAANYCRDKMGVAIATDFRQSR